LFVGVLSLVYDVSVNTLSTTGLGFSFALFIYILITLNLTNTILSSLLSQFYLTTCLPFLLCECILNAKRAHSEDKKGNGQRGRGSWKKGRGDEWELHTTGEIFFFFF